jgi:hypothetical protein
MAMAGRYDLENLYPENEEQPPPSPKSGGGGRYDLENLYPVEPKTKHQAEMRSAHYTPTESFTNAVQDTLMRLGAKSQVARHLAEGATGISGITPIGSILSAADLAHNIATGGGTVNAMLDAIGMAPGGKAIQRAVSGMPRIRPAEVPPPWVAAQARAGDPVGQQLARDWVTPSTAELIAPGQAGTPGRPAVGLLPATAPQAPVPPGSAIVGYDRVRNSPVMYDPLTGRDIQANLTQYLESPAGGAFSPNSAPGVYATMERHAADWEGRNSPIPASYFDNLRSQFRNMPEGADRAAGSRAANFLDRYQANPTPGAMILGNPQDFTELQANLRQARGDYRAGKTAETVENAIDRAGTRAGTTHSGTNISNTTGQKMEALQASDAVNDRLFGATQDERAAVRAASQGDTLHNWQRYYGKFLGGGGGMGKNVAVGLGGAAGAGTAHMMGLDPAMTMAAGAIGGGIPYLGGSWLTRAANERMVAGAENVANQIRRNSPEYAARVAATPDIIDPNAMARDAITYALVPQIRQQGKDVWDELNTPYEDR